MVVDDLMCDVIGIWWCNNICDVIGSRWVNIIKKYARRWSQITLVKTQQNNKHRTQNKTEDQFTIYNSALIYKKLEFGMVLTWCEAARKNFYRNEKSTHIIRALTIFEQKKSQVFPGFPGHFFRKSQVILPRWHRQTNVHTETHGDIKNSDGWKKL